MVAIFTGLGSGFERGSVSVLGAGGLWGSSNLGRSGDDLSLNAATGNLVITQQDEFLVGVGPDASISRTYNSLGNLPDDNNDNWRQSTDRRIYFTGSTSNAGTVGSAVHRIAADGSDITYTWDATWNNNTGAYVTTEGGGAYDTITYDSAGNKWTWTDGDSQITETYALYDANDASDPVGKWRLSILKDTDGNKLTYTYDAQDRLAKVTTQDGEYIAYSYDATFTNRVAAVQTFCGNPPGSSPTLTRTSYAYDSSGRLITAIVDLSPEDGLTTDGNKYTTTYGYDTNGRISSITQTDGSSVTIHYDALNNNRVDQIVQTVAGGTTRTTDITYSTVGGLTTTTLKNHELEAIGTGLGLEVTVVSDSSGRLTEIRMPPAVNGGPQQYTAYTYNSSTGDVLTVTSGTVSGATYTGHTTTYSGYSHGNWTTRTDSLGNITTRTYGAKNELLTETTSGADAATDNDSGTPTIPSDAPHLVRYAYDSENHLRFVISAEGRITEYRYTGGGLVSNVVGYPEIAYGGTDLSTLSADQWESTISTWLAGRPDLSSIELSQTVYDFRGNATEDRHWSIATTAGLATSAEGRLYTYTTYDQAGQLLTRNVENRNAESFTYDGLRRLTTAVDVNGGTTSYRFDDASTRTIVTFADGHVETSVFDKAGELISHAETGRGPIDSDGTSVTNWVATGSTVASTGGRLRVTNTGASAGRASQSFATVVGQTYSVTITGYRGTADALITAGTTSGGSTLVNLAPISSGSATLTVSFVATSTTTYLNLVANSTTSGAYAEFDNIKVVPSETFGYDQFGRMRWSLDATGRKSYFLYDGASRKIADIASDGTMVEYAYDADNRLVATVAYNNKVTASLAGLDTELTPDDIATYRPLLTNNAADADVWNWRVYDTEGRLIQTVAGDGSTTIFSYDREGKLIKTRAYINKLDVTAYKTRPPSAITALTAATADASYDAVTRNFYDKDGRLIGTADAEQNVTQIKYDLAGQITEEIAYANASTATVSVASFNAILAGITQSSTADRHTRYVYNGQGQLRFVVDPLLHVTEYQIDNSGGGTAVIAYANALPSNTTDFTYDYLDGSTTGTGVAAAGFATAGDRTGYSVYDSAGRVAYSIDAEDAVTAYSYNAAGQVTKIVRFADIRSTSALPSQVTMDSWAAGSAGSNVNNRVTRNYYNGSGVLTYTVDGEGYVTKRTEDAEGRLLSTTTYLTPVTVTDATTYASLESALGGTVVTVSNSYDPLGRLDTTTDGDGYVTKYEYWANGLLYKKSEAYGTADVSVTQYDYDKAGRMVTETSGANSATGYDKAVTSYGYDALGNIVTITDPDLFVTTRTFDQLGNVLTSTDAVGQVTRYLYNAFGEVVRTTDVHGGYSYNYYDLMGRVSRSSDALNNVTDYVYTSFGEIASVTHYYNAPTNAGSISATVPPIVTGNARDEITSNYYDHRGQLVTSRDGEDYLTETTYNAFGQISTVTRRWNKATGTRDPVAVPTVAVDAAHDAVTAFLYERRGFSTKITDAMGSFESYVVDAFGNRKQVTNKLGGITTNTYNGRGLLVSEALQVPVYNSAGTQVASSITNSFTYDGRGNRKTMVEASGLAEARTTSYKYDLLDRLIEKSGDAVTTVSYDDFSSTPSVTVTTSTGVIPKETYAYDHRGNLRLVTDANGARTFTYFDGAGRKTKEIGPLGTMKTWSFDVVANTTIERVYTNTVAVPSLATDPEPATPSGTCRETIYGYDPLDRLASTTINSVLVGTWVSGSNGVSTSQPDVSSTITYDSLGNVVTTTDANGNKLYSWYDRLGRKTVQVDQENYVTNWSYDSEGNFATETRFATKYVGTPNPASGAPTVAADATNDRTTNFTYDRNGNRLTETRTNVVAWTVSGSNGALTAIIPGNSVVTYTYNGLGEVLTKQEATGDTVTYSYDLSGRLTQEKRASYADRTENGLYNAQFSNTSGWTVDNPNSIVRIGCPYVGSQSGASYLGASILASGVGQSATLRTDDAHSVAVTAGDKLYVEAGIETTGTANGATLIVDYLNSAGTLISSSTIGALSGTQAYNTKISGTVTVVAGAAKVRLRLATTTSASGNGTFSLIDPLVEKIAASQTNNLVTPTVNYFYNGLNDLSRTEQLGAGSLASRVTTYAYQAGSGRLASMTDPSGKTHSYDYDAAGNVVRDSYTRLKSDNTTVDEGILYRRDLLGRVVTQTIATKNSPTSWTRGDSQNTQYNAFGDVAQRGINGLWQESFTYNNRGLVESTNTGDGVWRFYVYDKQGNQVLAVEDENYSDVNGFALSTKSLSDVLGYLGTYAGATYIDGLTVTVSTYDKRNQALSSIQTQRELKAGDPRVTLTSSQAYNAFGEVASQTDALSKTTTFTYNTMGRLISKVMPQVSVTSEAGVVSNVNPTETYYYDLSGRQVGVKDANNHTSSQLLLAGSGYGGSDALILTVFHPDGGALKTLYDVFGDARVLRNELSYDEVRTYDGMGRVASIVRRTGLREEFTYDLLGQQVKHLLKDTTGTIIGTDTSDYDVQGRVVTTTDQGGDTTNYSYAWVSTLTNTGMSGSTVVGGWTKTTMMWAQLGSTLWKTRSETTDVHGLTTAETDLGGHSIAYTYDRAGRLTQKQGTAGSVVTTLAFTYLNTGFASTVVDSSTGMTANSITSTFGYDADGRRTSEKYTGTIVKSVSDTSYASLTTSTQTLQDATIVYDALGRMTSFTNKNASGVTDMTVNQYYDAAGNIRHTASTYPNLVTSGSISTDKWFTYDAMNRMAIVNGTLVNGWVQAEDVAGAQSIGYDFAGNRKYADTLYTEWVVVNENTGEERLIHQTDREAYNYDADNQLSSSTWKINNETLITRDILGRVTHYTDYVNGGASNDRYDIVYNARGQVDSEHNYQVIAGSAADIDASITNTYDSYGNMTGTVSHNAGITDTSQTWTFGAWYDGAVVTGSDYDKDYYGSNTLWHSDQVYDGLGRLQRAIIADQKPRAVHFALNSDGMVVMKAQSNNDSNDPDDVHRFVSGRQVGEYTNDANEDTRNYDYATMIADKTSNASGTGRFYHGATAGTAGGEMGTSGYDPINAITSGTGQNSRSRYTVQSGDTLQGIAASLWGDSSLWYKLAEANGLSADAALTAGQNLAIPLQGPSSKNNADMFRPYDASSAVGDLSPTSAKPPKKNKCGVLGAVLLVAIAVAVTIITSGAALAAATPGLSLGGGITAAVGGSATLASGAAFTGGLVSTFGVAGGIAIGAAAGAAGSIVSQGVGVATGLQQNFSWKGVALSALTAGISAGVGTVPGLTGAPGLVGVGQNIARGVISNVATQGIAVATGLQHKFNWAGVAAAAAVSGVSGEIRMRGIGGQLLSGSAGSLAGAATRSVIDGSDFGDNVLASLPDVVGQTIGGIIADGVSGRTTGAPGTSADTGAANQPVAGVEGGGQVGRGDPPIDVGGAGSFLAGLAAVTAGIPLGPVPDGPVRVENGEITPDQASEFADEWRAVSNDPKYSSAASAWIGYWTNYRAGAGAAVAVSPSVAQSSSTLDSVRDTLSGWTDSAQEWSQSVVDGWDSVSSGLMASPQGRQLALTGDFLVGAAQTVVDGITSIPRAAAHPTEPFMATAGWLDSVFLDDRAPTTVASDTALALQNGNPRAFARGAGGFTAGIAMAATGRPRVSFLGRAGTLAADAGVPVTNSLAVLEQRLGRLGYDPGQIQSLSSTVSAGGQVVVVGENMRRVSAMSRMVESAGGQPITYAPRNFGGVTRNALEANRSWLSYWAQDKGAAVIDIGRQSTFRPTGPSPFYGLENRSLHRWGVYTPF